MVEDKVEDHHSNCSVGTLSRGILSTNKTTVVVIVEPISHV